jgi:hypothetical protein
VNESCCHEAQQHHNPHESSLLDRTLPAVVFALSWPFQLAFDFLGNPFRPILLLAMIMAGVGMFVAGRYVSGTASRMPAGAVRHGAMPVRSAIQCLSIS